LILCGSKGLAGVYLHSASLLADAAHSLSDTFSDIVTLFCWKMSQKPASITHPLGYGKFETMGGLGVSVVLVAGAFAIGMHSYGLLLEVLQPALQDAPTGIKALGSWTGDLARMMGGLFHHDHHNAAAAAVQAGEQAKAHLGHDGANLLDPNAMWFALISVLVKEWLYRATLKIAKEENSSVLEANAIHHRSDSLSSMVTFLAIGGSYMGFPVLDPLGGLLVAGLIGKQGAELLLGALQDLSDRGVQPEVLEGFENALKEVMQELEKDERNTEATRLAGWTELRAVRSGVSSFVDVTLVMSEDTKLKNARIVEEMVRDKIMAAHKGVKEVRVHLDTESRFESK
jgi:cation diffusion facilitator family transporter